MEARGVGSQIAQFTHRSRSVGTKRSGTSLGTKAQLRLTPEHAGMLPTERDALLIFKSLVRVQVGKQPNTQQNQSLSPAHKLGLFALHNSGLSRGYR